MVVADAAAELARDVVVVAASAPPGWRAEALPPVRDDVVAAVTLVGRVEADAAEGLVVVVEELLVGCGASCLVHPAPAATAVTTVAAHTAKTGNLGFTAVPLF